MTIRQSPWETVRNSNVKELERVCNWLSDNEYTPIVVPDSEAYMTGNQWKHDFESCSQAAMSPELRLALYEQCVTNIMTNCGCVVQALMADVPLVAFKMVVPGVQCCQPDHLRASSMSEEDDWGPYKRLVWKDDVAENMIPELEKMMPIFSGKNREKPKDFYSIRKAVYA